MRDKQIEELAALLKNCLFCEVRYNYQYNFVERIFDYEDIAETIIEEGYRKASDVAREIFEDVEKHLKNLGRTGYVGNMSGILAELKKKYESEEK